MNKHLSQDQLSLWILGRSTAEELRHGRECSKCRAELARFEAPVAAFRSSVMEWSERESTPHIEDVLNVHRGRQVGSHTFWRWTAAGAAAALLLIGIPIYRRDQARMQRTESVSEIPPLPPIDIPADTNADEILMDAVSV